MPYPFDPELADIANSIPKASFDNPAESREAISNMMAPFLANLDTTGVIIEEQVIPGPADAPELRVRLYRPDGISDATAGLLYIHGGGFVVGDLDSEHAGVVSLCRDLGIIIASVDYRLAPEHPYPAAVEDCFSALEWFHQNGRSLGIDPERIAIMGNSAGGGLSAALALTAKTRGGPRIAFQVLGIPELDDRLNTHSMTTFVDTPLWSRPQAQQSWSFYLEPNYQAGADNVPITAAPARATIEDLADLPPAYVTTMEFDPLRDEGIAYASQLMQAGVSVELHCYPGTFHGSSMAPHAAVSQREAADLRAVLKKALQLV